MARIKNLNVSGMSVEDIRQLDTRTLSDKALKQALNRLVSAGNKRLRRLSADEFGKNSPAVQRTKSFSARGLKTRGEIKAEYERVRSFLDPSKKSHTVRGWRQTVKQMEQRGIPKQLLSDPGFYSLYRDFEKKFVPNSYDSDTLFLLLSSMYGKYDTDEIFDKLERGSIADYETSEHDETDEDDAFTDDFSEYFY